VSCPLCGTAPVRRKGSARPESERALQPVRLLYATPPPGAGFPRVFRSARRPRHPGRLLPGAGPRRHIALNVNGRLLLLRLADVVWLEAKVNRTALHVGSETHLLDDCLPAVAAKLPIGYFLRIGPSALVSLRQIKDLRRTSRGGWRLLLRNGTRLTVPISSGRTLRHNGWCLSSLTTPEACTRLPFGRAARS